MLLIPIMIKFVNLNCVNSNFGNLNSVEIFIFLHWPDLDFLARLGLLGLAGNSWLGLLGRAEISWPDWDFYNSPGNKNSVGISIFLHWPDLDFLARLGLLGLAGNSWLGLLGRAEISWPDWDFLAWLGLLGLALTSWPGKDFLAF